MNRADQTAAGVLSRRAFGLGLAAASVLTAARRAGAQSSPPWMPVLAGAMASLDVERALYARDGDPRFYVRVRVVNHTPRALGLDLRERARTVFANQWQRGDAPARGTIDERRAVVPPLDAATQTRLRAGFASGALVAVPASGSVAYFGAFNASGRRDVDARAGRFVIVSLAGACVVTDGHRDEQLRIDGTPGAASDLVVAAPVAWGTIAPGASVVPG